MRAYRMTGPVGSAFSDKWPGKPSELLWQIQRFHSFLWASGGAFSDFYIHVIDHCCWMKNAWPVKAQAVGGRHYRTTPDGKPCVDQNFDSYSVEYTFADGAKLFVDGRCMAGCQLDLLAATPTAPRARAIVSKSGDCGGPSSTLQGPELRPRRADLGIEDARRRGQPLPERMERPGRRHPQRQALQRGRDAA